MWTQILRRSCKAIWFGYASFYAWMKFVIAWLLREKDECERERSFFREKWGHFLRLTFFQAEKTEFRFLPTGSLLWNENCNPPGDTCFPDEGKKLGNVVFVCLSWQFFMYSPKWHWNLEPRGWDLKFKFEASWRIEPNVTGLWWSGKKPYENTHKSRRRVQEGNKLENLNIEIPAQAWRSGHRFPNGCPAGPLMDGGFRDPPREECYQLFR